MAHYTYDYSCGHGRGSVQLFGKTCDRERKLTWLGESMVCRNCYKLRAKAQDASAKKQLILTVGYTFDTVTLQMEATGQIENNKEALILLS